MESLSKVAVVGMGKIGTVLATNLVKGNRAVIIADRTDAKSEGLAKSLGNLSRALYYFPGACNQLITGSFRLGKAKCHKIHFYFVSCIYEETTAGCPTNKLDFRTNNNNDGTEKTKQNNLSPG